MLQYSKLLNSRNEWREKATKRSVKMKEFRKEQKCYRAKIVELKQRNRELEQLTKDKKKENT